MIFLYFGYTAIFSLFIIKFIILIYFFFYRICQRFNIVIAQIFKNFFLNVTFSFFERVPYIS